MIFGLKRLQGSGVSEKYLLDSLIKNKLRREFLSNAG
jgi:hypothetical protein